MAGPIATGTNDDKWDIRYCAGKRNAAVLRCDNPFWKFSLAVYARSGVADECLALQNTLDIDVNALLFCAWLGAANQRLLDDAQIGMIDREVKRWHEAVVRPLRAVRQTMKPMPEMADDSVKALRKEIAAAELSAEQIEQAMLFEAAERLSDGAAMAAADVAVAANVNAFIGRRATGAAAPSPRLLIAAAIAYRPRPDEKP